MIDYKAVLQYHSQPVPRYTSYPTAPQFKVGEGLSLFSMCLSYLNSSEPVSAYIHIPFCDRLCWFCGCHTKHTLKYSPVARYMKSLVAEVKLFTEVMSLRPKLGQLHLGGGSPSLLQEDDLRRLREALEEAFEFDSNTEISIEIDPSDVTEATIKGLKEFGLTRASIGVQDFDPNVQEAINRPQSFETTQRVVELLRSAGVGSINIDALYGLPLQTMERLLRTVDQCVSLLPDRMALFGYAHVPWLKKHQRLIREEDLANNVERFEHAQAASELLQQSGYLAIGIDHFAKPDDSLAEAMRVGSLHRNFQGYTTDNHETLLGFGASSIGRFSDGYVQNTVATEQYQKEVAAGTFPKSKGMELTADDKLRAHIIERLMCNLVFDFDTLGNYPAELVDKCYHTACEFIEADDFGLCKMEGKLLIIEAGARSFARIVAAQFDAYIRPKEFQYSKAV